MSMLLKLLTAARVLGPYLLRLVAIKKGFFSGPVPAATEAKVIGLVGNLDARAWAREWARTIAVYPGVPYDEGAMIAWFSQAIMTGYDAGTTFKREYPASEAAASIPVPRAGAVSMQVFETDGASFPCSAQVFAMRHLCAVCNKHPGECEAKGIAYGIDADPKAKGFDADKVIACESFEAKA